MSSASDSSHFTGPKELLESLECSICANIFVEPKQLGCGHTFCMACVSQKIQKTAMNLTIQCPQCRDIYKIPEGGLSTNFIVKDLIHSADSVEMSRKWLELQRKASTKKKRKQVDVSKGRKIRYVAIEQLVNFFPATPELIPWSQDKRNELFKSLFT